MPNEDTYYKYKADSEKLKKIKDYVSTTDDRQLGIRIINNILRIIAGKDAEIEGVRSSDIKNP